MVMGRKSRIETRRCDDGWPGAHAADDEVCGKARSRSVAGGSNSVANLFLLLQPAQVHTAAVVCDPGAAAVSQDRLSRCCDAAGRMVRRTRGSRIETRAALLDALLCRTTTCKRGSFESLLTAAIARARQLGLIDRRPEAAVDATGFEARHASRYYVFRSEKGAAQRRSWPKLTGVCHTRSHLIVGAVVTRGPS